VQPIQDLSLPGLRVLYVREGNYFDSTALDALRAHFGERVSVD
jgi:hypothetical protein